MVYKRAAEALEESKVFTDKSKEKSLIKEEGGEVMSCRRFNLAVFFAICAASFLVFPISNSQAAVVSFDIGVIFNGDGVPTNPAPWANATFTDISSGQVKLTIAANGLISSEKVGGVYLNLDPALDPALLAFSTPINRIGDFLDPSISKGTNLNKCDGDGYFDILLAFDTDGASKAFNGGDSIEYTITLPSLTANSFEFMSAQDGGVGQYEAAAHLMGLGQNSLSAWATTPEPATLLLFAVGATAVLRRRK